ncbi:MAG: HTTM domain-containing protein, partial [Acidimicrobiia bacterium]|nr:HTTM domain-containing protein [Acidimicrobiia bacterium]
MKAPIEWPADLRSSVLIEAFLLVLMVDRISFPAESASVLGVGSLFAAVVGLLLRNPIAAFAAFALDAANLINHLPEVANHLTVLILVDIALLVLLARSGGSKRAPVALRYGLILLYLTAGFHKLNSSYTDISVSCARFITDRTLTWFALPPSGDLLATVNVWLGVLIEFTIPVLLVVRRTRWLGLLTGLIFHGLLALTPIGGVASFSMFIVALYVVFFDTETLRRINQWRSLLPDGVLRAATRGIGPVIAATVVTAAVTTANVFAPGGPTLAARFSVFLLICLLLAVFVHGHPWVRREPVEWRPTPGAALVSLYIMVAASLPYLGGRTQLAFSMFSNLRTE